MLDGGTTDEGLPYFIMEYVEVEPIDGYCDARSLTISERLELFEDRARFDYRTPRQLELDAGPGEFFLQDRDIEPASVESRPCRSISVRITPNLRLSRELPPRTRSCPRGGEVPYESDA